MANNRNTGESLDKFANIHSSNLLGIIKLNSKQAL